MIKGISIFLKAIVPYNKLNEKLNTWNRDILR